MLVGDYRSILVDVCRSMLVEKLRPHAKAPEVLESAPHRLQSSSAIPRHRSQLLTVSELHRDQASSSCSAVVGLQIWRRESFAVTEGRAEQGRN
ncbi:hypothetical protein YC2023_083333 [Brassica napus]